MIVVVENESTSQKTAFFGANDFNTGQKDDGLYLTEVWLHRNVDVEDDEDRMFDVHGHVTFATEEATKITIDLVEILADHIYYDDRTVVVGLTNTFYQTVKAAQACVDEDELDTDQISFIGDMSLIE